MNGLAAERTALSWRRTGLSCVAAAGVLLRLDTALSAAARAGLGAAALMVLAAAEIRQAQLRRVQLTEAHPGLVFVAAAAVTVAGICLLLDAR
ncbi:DUF202 domain-containing protein [Catellatospora sp. NPDC049609]|uniref:DUF202 domain-containing protein n=1 Tax=Catellatospora sp. NPDC049609 TaxID=3155505 RepID=UPI003443F5E0